MSRRMPEFGRSSDSVAVQIANRNAYRGMSVRSATLGVPPRRRLEQACVRMQEAAEDLEAVLASLPSPTAAGAEDVHEALGTIMETLRLLHDAHGRLETRETLRVIGSGNP